MKYLFILTAVVLIAGCTTAGPYVTGISSDGKGGLIIQKGYAEYNMFFGVLGNKEAGQSTIKVLGD